ncbi:hypothetical protein NE237_004184 [Protea cynaroides]|uniref:Uncharacterized protein n=1 Tax=Protea cynaroides TaxID=273540 RepID=A0A9Q0QTB5_9MAGN|nr:hypothetical protein NE237_004184 [Protea cynaroides]
MGDDSGEMRNLEPWKRLDGKIVMVTGASSGLGREFCLNLAMAGCNIVAAARRKDRLKSLCDEINQMKPVNSNALASSSSTEIRAVGIELDVTAAEPVIDASVQIAWNAFGRIDALVNAAGVRGSVSSSVDLSEEEWNTTIRTNLYGSWLVTKAVCRHIRKNGLKGSVIFISSISGIQRGELPGGIAYGAGKASLNAMAKIMAIELGPINIRVNSIAPGLFKSEITDGLMQKDWLDTVAKRTVPLRTFGTSDPALTSLIRYLIHDSSSYITGNIFIVDAGNTLPDLNQRRMGDEGSERCLEPWNRLDGKVVMVTGASSGLGREFCLNLAMAGCNIIAAARRKDRLKTLCDEINQKWKKASISSSSDTTTGIRAVAVELDLSAAGPVIDASVQIAWDAFGRIDALVNAAGVRGTVSSPLDLSEEEWNNTVKTNLTGSWLVTKSTCRRMQEHGLKGSRGELPGGSAYVASKAGINAMTKVMALEFGPRNIRVNSIAPGLFKSEITEGLMHKDWLNNVALKTIPLRKLGTIDPALTSLIRFLIHESSSYVSGNVFIVDSGNTLPGCPIFSSL